MTLLLRRCCSVTHCSSASDVATRKTNTVTKENSVKLMHLWFYHVGKNIEKSSQSDRSLKRGNTQEGSSISRSDTVASIRLQLNVLMWHLGELGGVRKNDNRFDSFKELSQDAENNSVQLSYELWKHKRKVFTCLMALECTEWKSVKVLLWLGAHHFLLAL